MTRRPIIVVCPKTGPTLIADSDHTLMMADYSQIELRLLAHLSKDPTLIKTFFQREDRPMTDPTNAQITRTLAEKVMGWHRKVVVKGCNPTWHDSAGILKSTDFDDPDDFPWNPCGNRDDLAEVLAKLTPEQWYKVNRSLPTIHSVRSDTSPRHGFSWWLLTCDPAIIARAVAEVVGK